MKIDRRTLVVGGGAGVGLVLGLSLWPRHLESDLSVGPGEQAFGLFLKIARNGMVTIAVPQIETGQGIWTGLAQVVADELGAAWDDVGVEPAPLMKGYGNPLAREQGWPAGIRITAGSTSVRAFELPLREGAAIARAMLIGAAADRWGVSPSVCDTADGLVISNLKSIGLGELAEEAASRSPPRTAPLRQASARRMIGQPLRRLDGPAKVDGSWRFAADVRLPGMLFASVRLPPPGGRLSGFSHNALAGRAGVRRVHANSAWIAVVADSWWMAEEALLAAEPVFSGERTANDVRKPFEDAIADAEPSLWFERGNYMEVVRGSRPLAATYFVAPSQHLGLEPLSATARVKDGAVELWAATQAPRFGQSYDAFYPMPSGEPAGRSMEPDAAPIAVELARVLGQPVQVIVSANGSQNHDRLAPGALARMAALPGAGGITAAWSIRVATADGLGSAFHRLTGRNMQPAVGQMALEGSVPPYAIPAVRVEAVSANLPFTAGYMRGSPQREFAFFTESFIDELAHAAGMEPVAFRMSMLGRNPPLARCFQSVAQLAGWDGGSEGSTMGIAGASAFGSHIALVATASVGEDQRIKVHRLVACVDCGGAVNAGLVEQQIESGLLWALAQATLPRPEWIAGMPRARPVGAVGLPLMSDMPEIVIQILPGSEGRGGISGLGTIPLAPAVANAIHAATGRRLRSLPFDLGTAA